MNPAPLFSIILATRDRARLFAAALDSVARQTCTETEIIVVNDGSRPEELPAYDEVLRQAEARLGPRLKSFCLIRRPRGHGQSYSLNYGVEQASGEYVCFLDDDDLWIDDNHLERAATVLHAAADAGRPADLYMANQEALAQGRRLTGPIWLETLAGQLRAAGRSPDERGAYAVTVDELMACNGFCHLNCLMVRRERWLGIGGMDEGIRWECDRDVYLRLLDVAGPMFHHPATTSHHHVPDPKAGSSMTTSLNNIERRLWQLRVLDKAALLLKHPALRSHARTHKGYALKRIAEELAARGDWRVASSYAAEGLGVLPTFKWGLFTLSCFARRLIGARNPPDRR